MLNYRWKEDSDKPEEDYKDFPDCVRYVALEQPIYKSPALEGWTPAMAPQEPYKPLTYGLVMR
jgi:hypothetical protein